MDWNSLRPQLPDVSALQNVKFTRYDDAEVIAEDIVKAVNEYNLNLDEDHEVGVMLASFGQTVTINITAIGHKGAKLLKLIGNITESGAPVELYQHVNQLSFLLVSLPRESKEEPKKQIGFINE
ncbi:hypothetical protein J7E81_15535 [Bacillus sp. ISL-18]|uniref:DUF6173 family protein n=1 Tax=Bacillus sp. ISL-18 TaxID=2819118 RepID=UPI001BEA07C2|nr:DUF6173 family protein [Bacillus sp. ISL-18]MBT2656631.1 hypothetical protein [Bacillus sp. ISL-18]